MFFDVAIKFVSTCTLQVEPPSNPYADGPLTSKKQKRSFQLLAFLLANRNAAKDITSVAEISTWKILRQHFEFSIRKTGS